MFINILATVVILGMFATMVYLFWLDDKDVVYNYKQAVSRRKYARPGSNNMLDAALEEKKAQNKMFLLVGLALIMFLVWPIVVIVIAIVKLYSLFTSWYVSRREVNKIIAESKSRMTDKHVTFPEES